LSSPFQVQGCDVVAPRYVPDPATATLRSVLTVVKAVQRIAVLFHSVVGKTLPERVAPDRFSARHDVLDRAPEATITAGIDLDRAP